jgi:hypothetical protein
MATQTTPIIGQVVCLPVVPAFSCPRGNPEMTTKRRKPPIRSVRLLPTGVIRIQVPRVVAYYARVLTCEGTFLVRLDTGAVYRCSRAKCDCPGDRPSRPCKHRRGMIALADRGKLEF